MPQNTKNTKEPHVSFEGQRVTLIPGENQWHALIGIPIKHKTGQKHIAIKWTDGKTEQKTFKIINKDYPEQRLIIKNKRKVEPNKEDLDRIWTEQKQIKTAKTSWQENLPDLNMSLPIEGRFSSLFGLKRFFNDKPRNPHSGLDIAAPRGTPIYAPAPGIVVETGEFFFSGNCVFINHGKGVVSLYAHMTDIHVKPGQEVKRGEQLGTVGDTGRVTGPHLHWSIGLNGTWVDPSLFLNKKDRP